MRKNTLVCLLLACILLAWAGGAFSSGKKKDRDELYRQAGLFSDSLAIIHEDYVEDKTPKDLIYGALKGMLSSLDAHSQFMDPDTYNELKVDTEGRFGGVGVEITVKDGLLTVITPIEDTPAWKAGIKANDHIVKIDGELTREITLPEAVKKMRGRPGEAIKLTVLRDSEKKLLEFKIVRDVIRVKDVKYSLFLEDGIGYIRLTEFRDNTQREFDNALNSLMRKKPSGLILDLRNNPGGLLDSAVKVAGRFIPPGKMIAYTKGRKKDQEMEFISDSKNAVLDLPLVVLVNGGSASGSEIVAGVLQDYKRAILIGEKTFGKGSVQTVIPLGDGSALRLTTAYYFTPSGKVIHEKGIVPDIIVSTEQPSVESRKAPEKMPGSIFAAGAFDYKADRQISRAVDTLKTIELYKQSDRK